MAAIAEINISISLETNAPEGRHGISRDAETLVDECFYLKSGTATDVLSGVEDALEDALKKIRSKVEETWKAERKAEHIPDGT